jgi:hypothetical protein
MKTILRILFLLVAALYASAQTRAPQASGSTAAPTSAGSADLVALERFLALSDDELAQMADAIARVRAMTPAQRAALRDQIVSFRQLPEPQRMQLRQGWGWMPAEIQNGWREMMQGATPEERAAIQSKMQSLSPDERMRYRRELVETYLKAKGRKQ